MEIKDINQEYERIFGVTQRPTLYAPDDVEYLSLYQEILAAPRDLNHVSNLPFDEVKLLPYDEFLRNEIVIDAEKKGHRIFYIKQYEVGKLVAYGAGFFNPKDSNFVVLKGAFFRATKYFETLVNQIYGVTDKSSFLNSFHFTNGIFHQKEDKTYSSASLAASYLLGKKASFKEWKDDKEFSLDVYYGRYRTPNIDLLENKTFSVNTLSQPQQKEGKSAVLDIINSLLPKDKSSSRKSSKYTQHVFFMKLEGVCNASGYYEEETGRFVVLEGSTFSQNIVSKSFSETSLGVARTNFIEAACEKMGSFYRVTKDTRCKSANAAASYLLGKISTYVYWKDIKGLYLKDVYPNQFLQSELDLKNGKNLRKVALNSNNVQYFYLKRNTISNRSCDAKGYYDKATKKFIIKAGSYISLCTTPTYNSSVAGMARRDFIKNACIRELNGYRVKQDSVFDSPSSAASVVVGASANGWNVWKDSFGRTLDSVYR